MEDREEANLRRIARSFPLLPGPVSPQLGAAIYLQEESGKGTYYTGGLCTISEIKRKKRRDGTLDTWISVAERPNSSYKWHDVFEMQGLLRERYKGQKSVARSLKQ